MSPGIIIAIGIAVAVALGVALVAAQRAGGQIGPEADYGRELEAPPPLRGRRRPAPGARQRAMLALVAGVLAAIAAGLAAGLSHGSH